MIRPPIPDPCKPSVTDLSVPPYPLRSLAEAEHVLLAPGGLDVAALSRVLADDPRPRRRFRRPLFPAFALRELEPRGRHRQVRHASASIAASACARSRATSRRSRIRTTSRSTALERGRAARCARSAARASRRRRRSTRMATRARSIRTPIRSASLAEAREGGAARAARAAWRARRDPRVDAGDGIARRRARDRC